MGRQMILLLKDGTQDKEGIPQIKSNIQACERLGDILRSTLGPRGSDKLIKGTITNDGATIMKLLDVEHPAAKVLADISKSQDAECGDGTTSVVVLAVSMLKEAGDLLDQGMQPLVIVRGYRQGLACALQNLSELQRKFDVADREALINVGATTLNSKLLASNARLFASMAVDAVLKVDEGDIELIGVKKVKGGSVTDSVSVDGVAFKKTFSYAGFEQQPKKLLAPKVLCLNIELELKAEKDNAEIRISNPDQYQSIVDAEWQIIYDKLKKCVDSGATVVLSTLAIGDLGTQYFADRNVFCAGRVPKDDMRRVCKATGAQMQTVLQSTVPAECLGTCGQFEERQVGGDRYSFFSDCPKASTATIIIRGGGDQFVDEAERSVHDAICAVARARKHTAVVAGGGAVEMALSKAVRAHSRTMTGKIQFALNSYAKSLECIPYQLALNGGYDATDIIQKLRYHHNKPNEDRQQQYGIDIDVGDVCDTFGRNIHEPFLVKKNALTAATEAACLILSVDRTITAPPSEQPADRPIGGRGRGRGR